MNPAGQTAAPHHTRPGMVIGRRAILAGLVGAAVLPGAATARGPRPPPRPPVPQPDEAALIAAAKLGGTVAWALRDAATGALIEAQGADLPLPPASTLKTVTALYALDRLGAGHRFATRVLAQGDGLVLAGGGDPVLDSDDFALLARQLAAAWRGRPGPARFAVWGGALPGRAQLVAGQAAHLSYNPALSGLNLNFNRVHLDWRSAGGRPVLRLEARADGASPVAGSIRAEAVARALPLFAWRDEGATEDWTVARGALSEPGSRWLPVRHPELYAGDVLRSLARAEGLVLPPPTLLAAAPPGGPQGEELARVESPSLDRIVRAMLAHSNNLTAEVLGLAASGAADTTTSAGLMRDWLAGLLPGAQAAALRFADHSGLSAESRVTAAALSGLMAGPGRTRGLRALMKPVPLATRTRGAEVPVTVLAKSGSLNFVSNLTGYAARSDGGRALAFAILAADEQRRAASAGEELPAGAGAWMRSAHRLQGRMIEGWVADHAAPPLDPAALGRG